MSGIDKRPSQLFWLNPLGEIVWRQPGPNTREPPWPAGPFDISLGLPEGCLERRQTMRGSQIAGQAGASRENHPWSYHLTRIPNWKETWPIPYHSAVWRLMMNCHMLSPRQERRSSAGMLLVTEEPPRRGGERDEKDRGFCKGKGTSAGCTSHAPRVHRP